MSPQSFARSGAPSVHASVPRVFCFAVQAEAGPGLMPRVLELFAKRNLVPSRWVSDLSGPARRELSIDLQVEGLTPELSDHIAQCLRQIPGVGIVLTSEKGRAVAAAASR